jgi:hypothetical protein
VPHDGNDGSPALTGVFGRADYRIRFGRDLTGAAASAPGGASMAVPDGYLA